ncbi:MAG: PAS domain S-box protein, partial [Ignavibacteriales bacterium]
MGKQGPFQTSLDQKLPFINEQIHTVLDNLADPFAVLSPVPGAEGQIHDFAFVYINHAGADYFNLDRKDNISHRLADYFQESQNPGLFGICRDVLQTDIPRKLKLFLSVNFPHRESYSGTFEISISTLEGAIALNWKDVNAENHKQGTNQNENREEILSGDQVKNTLENIRYGFFACDVNWNIVYVNAEAERLLDIRRQDVIGRNHWDIFPLTIGQQLETEYHKAAQGEIRDFDNFYEPWGRWFHMRCLPHDSGGIMVYFEDITEQKILQEKLKNSLEEQDRNQRRFERAEALAHVGSWVIDSEKEKMELSEEMTRILGIDPAKTELSPGDYLSLVHPDDYDRLSKAYTEYYSGNKVLDIDYRIIRPDGRIRFIHGISGPELNEHGVAVRRYGAAMDITDQKLAEESLNAALRQLKFHVENSPLAVIEFNNRYQIIQWSHNAEKIFGWKAEEVIGKQIGEFKWVHEEDAERVAQLSANMLASKKTSNLHTNRNYRKDGSVITCEWYNSALVDPNGDLISVFSLVLDITERKHAEEFLKQTLDALKRSNTDLEQFAYIASHDLQEPLRMVSNFAKLLSRRYKDKLDERANEYIEFMVDGSKRMQSLISDLLMYARVTTKAQPMVPVDLNKIMEDVLKDLKITILEKKARIGYEELPEINADPVQIRQLFQNLITNAIKFKAEDDPEIQIQAEMKQKEWLFSVKDNGIGISPEYYERIFVIFQRLHEREKYSGTGIGLALCKKIVEYHGGRIWVESAEGQ